MAEPIVTELKGRYDRIGGQLDAAKTPAELEGCKKDIIGFFKQVDGMVTDLTALRDDIKRLVEKYKALTASTKPAVPEFTGEQPVIHADHIGASTFIQKGWSLLSLGDYAGAIEKLQKAIELS